MPQILPIPDLDEILDLELMIECVKTFGLLKWGECILYIEGHGF